jgi:glycine/D-amino acid oxidase-like deaminating enzyme
MKLVAYTEDGPIAGASTAWSLGRPAHYGTIIAGNGLFGTSTALATIGGSGDITQGAGSVLMVSPPAGKRLSSSIGRTRITRGSNEENKSYTEMARSSNAVFRSLETRAGEILRPLPCFTLVPQGSAGEEMIRSNHVGLMDQRLAQTHDGAALKDLGFLGEASDWVAFEDQSAATIDPQNFLKRANERLGAAGVQKLSGFVESWRTFPDHVVVNIRNKTGDLEFATAQRLVLATAGETGALLRKSGQQELADSFSVKRVPLYFFDWPKGLKECAIRIVRGDGQGNWYAMQEKDDAGGSFLKMGFHNGGGVVPDAKDVPRKVTNEEIQAAKIAIEAVVGQALTYRNAFVCHYTLTKKHAGALRGVPIVGPIPGTNGRVALVSGGNGNGAKLAPSLGRLARSLFERAPTEDDLPFLPASQLGDPLRLHAAARGGDAGASVRTSAKAVASRDRQVRLAPALAGARTTRWMTLAG